MRWLSFERDGELSFGYVTSSGAGVVDAGARSSFSSLREAIEADALQSLVNKCGDEADLSLDGLTYAPASTTPAPIPPQTLSQLSIFTPS